MCINTCNVKKRVSIWLIKIIWDHFTLIYENIVSYRNRFLSLFKVKISLIKPRVYSFTDNVSFLYSSVFQPGFRQLFQGSVRILKLALFLVSRSRQKFNNVSKVPRLEKGWKALLYIIIKWVFLDWEFY